MADLHNEVSSDVLVHRVGGGSVENLCLSQLEIDLNPPGISVFLGGTPYGAAEQLRTAFPRSRKWQATAHTVGTATVADIRNCGFDVFPDPTVRFPDHARQIHTDGESGFSDENLRVLSNVFENVET